MTPEGKVKAKVKRVLDIYSDITYTNWPVPGGYGAPVLDCWGAIAGWPFAIETKVPGKKLTPRQDLCREQMQAGGITVFVCDTDESIAVLNAWMFDKAAGWKQ